MKRFVLIIVLLLFVLSCFSQVPDKRIIGYFIAWGVYGRDYHVPDIPAEKITHINYAFANIADGEIVLGDSYADIDKFYDGDTWDAGALRGSFHRLQVLKEEYPHVKTLISVGGWTWSDHFSEVASSEENRIRFAESCIDFVVEYDFDGVDIDWEYPVEGGEAGTPHSPDDRDNYTLLLAELREQLDDQGYIDGKEYLLSICGPANPAHAANIDIESVSDYVDYINIMAYDYHGAWGGDGDAYTNHNAPLYSSPDDPTMEPFVSTFNVEYTVNFYITNGLGADQLNLGMPFYGRGYGNLESSEDGLFSSYGSVSPHGTWETGNYYFDDLYHNYIDMAGYVKYWDNDCKVPWLYNSSENIFISYDDTMSIGHKARFVIDNNLGGAMFWEFCGDTSEMLVDKIYDIFITSTDIVDESYSATAPENITLTASPNPFNSSVVINTSSSTDIEIIDTRGHILHKCHSKGKFVWKPENIESGVYFVKSKSGNNSLRISYIK